MSEYQRQLNAIRAEFIGKSTDEAIAIAESMGMTVRAEEIDGRSCSVTCDINPKRINVAVVGGTVTDVFSID